MRGLAAAALTLLALPAGASAAQVRAGSVYAEVTPTEVVIGNTTMERRWARDALRTTALLDKRDGGRSWSAGRRDFTLELAGGADLGSELFRVRSAEVTRPARGGLRVTMRLSSLTGLSATRVAEVYPGIAGVRTQTTVTSPIALALDGVTLDEAAVGTAVTPTVHAFRAGSDWREPGYTGPPLAIGDPHAGTWRESRSAGPGQPLEAPGEWLSAADGARSLFMVAERVDFPSSRAQYAAGLARLRIAYARDVLLLGPLEESAHIENPIDGPGRARTLRPGVPLALEAAFTGFGNGDGDEPWQFFAYLRDHRMAPYQRTIAFNSDKNDGNRISTGAKDDTDIGAVRELAPIARRLGVETFILDDGWQARSGDWQPDSPQYPEPRGTPPRFPDSRFEAVREAIAPMKLGLWMSPMHFNPASETFRAHPEWACQPYATGLAAANAAQPDDGSNEAGIVPWSEAAIPHVEARIRDAIENWGVRYWKFDFMAWLDCAGQGDLYTMHDAFVAMIDRLERDFPQVTFQIDETNDYRLFGFESVARGPTWFQNGAPEPDRLLHNLWNLAPFVPGFALGQPLLGGKAYERHPVSTLMAAALLSHITLYTDIRRLPDRVIDEAAPWMAFYRAHREDLGQMSYPLLDDPLKGGWTALQPWDPERGRGALLAFRQQSGDATRTIALRNVPAGRTFTLREAPSGDVVGTVSSRELSDGLSITLPDKDTARVLLIQEAS